MTKEDRTSPARCPGFDARCNCVENRPELNCKLNEDNPNFCLYGIGCSCSSVGVQARRKTNSNNEEE